MLSIFYSINIDVDPTEDGDAKDLDLFDIHLLAHSLVSQASLVVVLAMHLKMNSWDCYQRSNFFTIQFNQVITAQGIIVDT